MIEKMENKIAEERWDFVAQKLHPEDEFLCDVLEVVFIAAIIGVMEDFPPENRDFFFFDLLHKARVVLSHKLFFQNPNVFLNKLSSNDLLIHFSDIFLEIFAKNLISISLLESFSFKYFEDLLQRVDILLLEFGKVINDGCLNYVFPVPEAVGG
jgi:hypothetical protein